MMTSSLQGQLDDGALANLLQYLSLNRADGMLSLHNAGTAGEVYFSGGRVVHVRVGDRSGVEALAGLLGWAEGTFAFMTNVRAPAVTVQLSVDSLLLEASYHADVLRRDREAITPESIVTPKRQSGGTLALNLQALQLLRHLDGRADLRTLAARLGAPIHDVMSAAEELVRHDAASFSNEPVAPAAFVHELTQLTANIMGPMAEIVIDDALYDLGFDREALPAGHVLQLVTEVRAQLKRDDWRRDFEAQSRQLCSRYGLSPKGR